MRKRIILRRDFYNTLTIPLLVNIIQKSKLYCNIDLLVWDIPGKVKVGDVVLYSIMTPFLSKIADEIRLFSNAGATIVVGGPHVSPDNYELLHEMGAHSVSWGDGEAVLISIVEHSLIGNGSQELTWPGKPITDSNFSKYLPVCDLLPTLPPLELMRGCGYGCAFCSTAHKEKHMRTWESCLEYIEFLKNKGASRINFITPSALEYSYLEKTVTESLRQLLDACQERNFSHIEFGIFPSEIRPETIDIEKLKLIKKYVSHRFLTIGVQSGSPERLESINRRCSLAITEEAIGTILDANFNVNLDFIIGYPKEDDEEFMTSLQVAQKWYKKGRVKLQIHRFFPLGNSRWQWEKPIELTLLKKDMLYKMEKSGMIGCGWRINEAQWQDYWHWLSEHHFQWTRKYT